MEEQIKEAGNESVVEAPPEKKTVNNEARLKELEENWKREQSVSSKKELRIKELESRLNDRDSDRDLMKILIASIAEQKGVTEDEMSNTLNQRKPDLTAQFEELDRQREEKLKQAEAKRQQDEYNARANAIWNEVKDLSEGDDNKDFVYTALMAGLPDKAEARIKKMKDGKSTKEEPEDEEEKKRESLEKKGSLSTDLPMPTGTGKTYTSEEIARLKQEAKTPLGLKRLMEAMPDIEKANAEGRIK